MNQKQLLDTAVLAGEIMLRSGAETYRVEDTMQHILKTSGAESIEVLALMTGIMATLNGSEMEHPITAMKTVNSRGTNLSRIIGVNDISRKYCGGELTLDEAYHKLKKLKGNQYSSIFYNIATIGVAAGFAMMFGGSILDVAAASAAGALTAGIITFGKKIKMDVILVDILSSVALSLLSMGLKYYFGDAMNMDTVIISAIMLLVPLELLNYVS